VACRGCAQRPTVRVQAAALQPQPLRGLGLFDVGLTTKAQSQEWEDEEEAQTNWLELDLEGDGGIQRRAAMQHVEWEGEEELEFEEDEGEWQQVIY